MDKGKIKEKLKTSLKDDQADTPLINNLQVTGILPHARYFNFLDQNNNSKKDVADEFFQIGLEGNLGGVMENAKLRTNFIKYNTVIPSSAPVERLFSIASLILSPKRFCLADDFFEKLIFLKTNKNYKILDC